MSEYVELHCHSCYSLQDGASFPEALLDRAVALGMPALALTDHNGLYGAVRFHRAAQERGIRPILGAEVTLEDESHLVVLAESEQGYRNLCWLLSRAQLENGKGSARLDPRHFRGHTDGLIALTGCRLGRVPRALLAGDTAAARDALRELASVFPARHLYVELQAHYHPSDSTLNARLAGLAADEGLPIVATNNVHYATADGQPLHDVLTALRHHATVGEATRWLRPNAEYYLKGRRDMAEILGDYPEALAATAEIASRCRVDLELRDRAMPPAAMLCDRAVPGMQEGVEADVDAALAALCAQGLDRRYPRDRGDRGAAERQLRHELGVIRSTHLAGYFLLVWDVVRFAEENGIQVRGRGSAANSVVAYVLGITNVDPIANDLLFERFLSAESHVMPDIDLDFCSRRREEVIQYVYQRYGERHVGMVANHVTYRPRLAVRDVGKALGMSADLVDALSKSLGTWGAGGLEEVAAARPELLAGVGPERFDLFLRLVAEIQGLPRHLSIHTGGMVITGAPLDELVPLERATMPGRVVVQWDKDQVEDAGLIKTDLLSLRTLSAVDECVRRIREGHGLEIDLDRLPLDDPAVYRDLQKPDTIGAFQVESRAQQQALVKMQCREFKDIAIEVALIRPGPLQGGMVHPYFRRRQGLKPVHYLHPLLEPALRETLGVIVFQEQIMKVAMAMGGFSPGEADMLRRAMSRRRGQAEMARMRERFIAGAATKGVETAVAEEVFRQIAGFASYGFCKSHAAAFGRTVYDTLWLRSHFPAEYYCAILNNEPMGFYAPRVIVNDARRHRVPVRGVDVNLSAAECEIEEGAIRLGFNYVTGLGETGAERILEARARGIFRGLEDLCRRTRLPRRQMEALIEAGALSAFDGDRRRLLWRLGRLRYATDSLPLELPDDGVRLDAMDREEEMAAEYGATGVLAEGHLMDVYREALQRVGAKTCEEMDKAAQGDRVRVAGVVSVRQQPPTARGMTFITLEDETGLANLVIRPHVLARYRAPICQAIVLLAEGRVERERAHVNIQVEHVRRIR